MKQLLKLFLKQHEIKDPSLRFLIGGISVLGTCAAVALAVVAYLRIYDLYDQLPANKQPPLGTISIYLAWLFTAYLIWTKKSDINVASVRIKHKVSHAQLRLEIFKQESIRKFISIKSLHLNGWQRIGVVISALWCIGAIGYIAVEIPNHIQRTVTVTYNDGMKIKYDNILENMSSHDVLQLAFIDRGMTEGVSSAEDGPEKIFPYKLLAVMVLLLIVAPITILWISAYLSIAIYRWIKVGFAISK